MRARRRWMVPVVLVLITAACGGGDGAEDTAEPATTGRSPDAVWGRLTAAADALIDQWGTERDAFYVVAWSLDGGYSARQILEAAPDGRVAARGAITDPNGDLAEPEYEPAGLLVPAEGEAAGPGVVVALAAPGVGLLRTRLADDAPSDAEITRIGLLSEVFDGGLAAFEANKEAQEGFVAGVTSGTLFLGARGYSGKQILLGLILRQIGYTYENSVYCFFLRTTDGRMVRPANPPADIITELSCPPFPGDAPYEVGAGSSTTSTTEPAPSSSTTTTTTASADALLLPRSYSGGGSATWSLSWANGSCLVDGNTLDLTLNADGTLSGHYGRSEPAFSSKAPPGAARPTVECSDQLFVLDPIEVTGRHTPPDPGAGEAGTVIVEIVGWADWHIEGEYTPSEMVFDWDLSLVANGYEGDEPDPRIIRAIDYQLVLTEEG